MSIREIAKNDIKGIKIRRNSPKIVHLLFTNDRYIFIKVNTTKINNIKVSLKEFYRASCQSINYEKLEVVFSKNTRNQIKNTIIN